MAVVGAGTLGNGIAHVFAQGGWDVTLIDVATRQLDAAMETVRRNMDRQIKKGALSEQERDAALARISTATQLEAVAGASLVVEAATESPELKFSIFEQLDRIAAEPTVLASNTSSISITEIAGGTGRPDRVIGMHFMNPVPVMELVEVIRGLGTSDKTAASVMDTARALGKTPVEVNDYPGFF